MNGFGIFILVAAFMIIRAAINNEQKRKKEQEQRAGRMQHAYDQSMRPVREPTSIERELKERAKSAQPTYGEGYSNWGNAHSGSLPPRSEAPSQSLGQGQSNWGAAPSGSLPPSETLSQGQSVWGTTPTGSLPPRNEEERKRREAAALAAKRAEALRRERMERIARNKSTAQYGQNASTEGTSVYGQEGISIEGSSLNSELRRHKLEASSITGHAHTESSLGGRADNCDDYAIRGDITGQQASPIPPMLQGLSLNNNGDIVKGFIIGEVLAKPKAMRR